VNEFVFAPLTQNQFDALVSLVFNIGVRAFRGSPTLRRLNEGRPLEAAMAMELWRKADLEGERIVIDALVRRRAAEKALFLKPTEGWVPAPSPILPPKLDYDALGMIPINSPVAARTATSGDRIYAERAPEGPAPTAPEPLSASAAAADAVIERLGAILAEPTVAPALAETPLVEPATEPLEPPAPKPEPAETPSMREARTPNLPPITFLEVKSPRRRWMNAFGVLILGAVGVGLLALAAIWGFQPATEQVLGVAPRTAGLALGFIGFISLSIVAYLVLDRLGLPRDRRSS
jgi:lysozyme